MRWVSPVHSPRIKHTQANPHDWPGRLLEGGDMIARSNSRLFSQEVSGHRRPYPECLPKKRVHLPPGLECICSRIGVHLFAWQNQ